MRAQFAKTGEELRRFLGQRREQHTKRGANDGGSLSM